MNTRKFRCHFSRIFKGSNNGIHEDVSKNKKSSKNATCLRRVAQVSVADKDIFRFRSAFFADSRRRALPSQRRNDPTLFLLPHYDKTKPIIDSLKVGYLSRNSPFSTRRFIVTMPQQRGKDNKSSDLFHTHHEKVASCDLFL